jgi:hypothetical protein
MDSLAQSPAALLEEQLPARLGQLLERSLVLALVRRVTQTGNEAAKWQNKSRGT